MKITSNFVTSDLKFANRAALVLFAASAFFLLLSFWGSRYMWNELVQSRSTKQNIKRITGMRQKSANVDTKKIEVGLLKISAEIQSINAMTQLRPVSVGQLLQLIEREMPEAMLIDVLHHKVREGKIQLLANAPNVNVVTQFLNNMEKTGLFSQVLLTKQSREKSPGRRIQFEIKLDAGKGYATE